MPVVQPIFVMLASVLQTASKSQLWPATTTIRHRCGRISRERTLLSTTMRCGSVLLLSAAARALTPLPPGINAYEVAAGTRNRPAEALAPVALRAIAAAREANVKLGEIEFPALLGEKTAFDDVDNVQILNWNRDWCMASMQPLAGDGV